MCDASLACEHVGGVRVATIRSAKRYRQSSYGHVSTQLRGGATKYMHGCGKARPLSMQLCSGVHCGHISAMHLMSVQGIQESHAVEVSVAPGGNDGSYAQSSPRTGKDGSHSSLDGDGATGRVV